ncbi:MAG: helix-turn-helix domain-containing protein [Prevotella sp.]
MAENNQPTQAQTQNMAIISHLKTGADLTSLDALQRFKCMRLSARIYDLRRQGYRICSERVKVGNGKHVERYWLEDEAR